MLVLGVEDPPPPTQGDAASAAWFRVQLEELGFIQGAFVRFMQRRGDDRPQRSIQRMCAGQARVSGEMRVLLGLMLRSKRRKMARAARKRDEREAPWNDLSETRNERQPAGEADLSESRSERPSAGETGSSKTRSERPAESGVDLSETRRERRLESGTTREAEHDARKRPAESATAPITTPSPPR